MFNTGAIVLLHRAWYFREKYFLIGMGQQTQDFKGQTGTLEICPSVFIRNCAFHLSSWRVQGSPLPQQDLVWLSQQGHSKSARDRATPVVGCSGAVSDPDGKTNPWCCQTCAFCQCKEELWASSHVCSWCSGSCFAWLWQSGTRTERNLFFWRGNLSVNDRWCHFTAGVWYPFEPFSHLKKHGYLSHAADHPLLLLWAGEACGVFMAMSPGAPWNAGDCKVKLCRSYIPSWITTEFLSLENDPWHGKGWTGSHREWGEMTGRKHEAAGK